jgi:outer membrane autotransporter protein
MLGWRHAFGDTTPVSTVAFIGGSPFNIAGAPIAEDAAAVEAGLDLNLTANMILGLAYGGQFGSGLTDQTVRGNFSIKF